MIKDILTDNEIKFNDLEKKVHKFVCELGCTILKNILEEYDRKIKETRDKNIFRDKGLRLTSLKTCMGVVRYKRTIYEYKTKTNENKYIYLLEEKIKLSEIGLISENLVEKILKIVVETNSYRDAAAIVKENFNIDISHETARLITLKAGIKIIEKEEKEIKLSSKEKLVAGTKIVPILFEEADRIVD